jgi:hypothetical protein
MTEKTQKSRRLTLGYHRSPGLAPVALLGAIVLAACGARQDEAASTTPRPGSLAEREPCVTEGADLRAGDLDADGRPELSHVFRDGARYCTELDMNLDGRADVVRFYDADGSAPRREEHDFDFDGRVDMVRFYEAGVLVRQELDTDFDNYIDTWLWCQHGRVVRSERDRFRRGHVDLWEEFSNGVLLVARYDDDRDGIPEKLELFEGGRLVAIGVDADGDGEPESREPVSAEFAGPAEEPLFCDLPAEGEGDAATAPLLPTVIAPPPAELPTDEGAP